MKPGCIKWAVIVLAMVWLTNWPVSQIRADILYSQPYDGSSPGTAAQIWTDDPTLFPAAPTFSTKAFDDVTVPAGLTWLITGVTIFGQEAGDPTQNVSVNFQFASSPNYNDSAPIYSSGSEDPTTGNLIFTFTDPIALTSGTYWLSAWVDRPGYSGGQWFWSETQPVIGSEYYTQNPGGGTNFGITTAIPGSTLGNPPADLAFEIDGTAVPEPASWCLLAMGGMGLLIRKRFFRYSRLHLTHFLLRGRTPLSR